MRWCLVVLWLASTACHSGDDLTPASGGAAGTGGTGASGGAGGSGAKGGTGGTGATGGSGGATGGASGSGGSGGDTGGTAGAAGAIGGTGGATGGTGGATGGTGGCGDTTSSISNCGSCGGVCSNVNNSAQSCSAGLCSHTCNNGFADCNGAQPGASDDGCETNTDTSAANCGSCGGACSTANNSAQTCSGGTCSYTCNNGFANCNGAQPGASDDGCETNTASDPSHCGNCTTVCGGAFSQCVLGTCTCPQTGKGPQLVPAGSYCIDSTEVTNAQYAAFLAANPSTAGQPSECGFNTTFTPPTGWPATGKDNYPVLYVDWCDAYAFCKWAGKRMCGRIGGGGNAEQDYADTTKSQWYNACSLGGTRTYPYGNTYSASACNIASSGPVPVGQFTTCEGGYPGIFDIQGNVYEWEDSCGALGNPNKCRVRGGAFDTADPCNADGTGSRDNSDGSGYRTGIRCCSP